jgi:ribosome-associated toxin RatA of RatAB toxin-antitoxin module
MTIHAIETHTIHASHDKVWDLMADVTTVSKWHPSVDRVDLLSSNKTGLGAARVCHLTDGGSVKEVVTRIDGEKTLHLEISKYDTPMKKLELVITVEPHGQSLSKVHFRINYDVKYGPIGYLLGNRNSQIC